MPGETEGGRGRKEDRSRERQTQKKPKGFRCRTFNDIVAYYLTSTVRTWFLVSVLVKKLSCPPTVHVWHVDCQLDEVGKVGVVWARVADLGREGFRPHGTGDTRLTHPYRTGRTSEPQQNTGKNTTSTKMYPNTDFTSTKFYFILF